VNITAVDLLGLAQRCWRRLRRAPVRRPLARDRRPRPPCKLGWDAGRTAI